MKEGGSFTGFRREPPLLLQCVCPRILLIFFTPILFFSTHPIVPTAFLSLSSWRRLTSPPTHPSDRATHNIA